MPECTNCGTQVDGSANFCPNCGEPQTEAAKTRFNQIVDKRAKQQAGSMSQSASQSTGSTSQREEIITRVSYALGFIFVVSAVSVLPNLGGVFTLLGGILLFPPVRLLTGRLFGSPIKVEVTGSLAILLAIVGTVIFYVL